MRPPTEQNQHIFKRLVTTYRRDCFSARLQKQYSL